MSATAKTNRIEQIVKRLKRVYPGATTSLDHDTPLNLLVATILSAQCTDRMVNKVTPRLFKKYKSAAAYGQADLRAFMREIRSIGLYKSKARNIKRAARMIASDFNGVVPDSMDKLILLPGVGRKTANIVLSNAFGKDEGIAVDTHVKRISRRLGLTGHTDPAKIESDLTKAVPKRYWGAVNHLLVLHGRAVCGARNPRHKACAIRDYCDWYKKNKEAR
jgi:endonuclease-3